MKRKLPLLVLVGLAGVLVPFLTAFAQTSSHRPVSCCPSAACTSSKPSAAASTDDKVIDELMAILKETKSPETFVVTAMVLSRIGPEAKRALPVLIRNAERLELFDELYETKAPGGSREIGQQVVEAIMMLFDGYFSLNVATHRCRPQAPAPLTPAAPYAYGGAADAAPPQAYPQGPAPLPATVGTPYYSGPNGTPTAPVQPAAPAPTKSGKTPRKGPAS